MGAEFFAGGNTAVGFVSRFQDVLTGEKRRIYTIKGGPGVGKSGLMKAVMKELEKEQAPIEAFRCSGDPDSLDAIAFPKLGAAMVDGTAPHVIDPALPGARDTLISLGDQLSETGLRPKVKAVDALSKEIGECYRKCYAYLAAASSIAKAAMLGEMDKVAAQKTARELAQRYIPKQAGQGRLRRLFARAYRHGGMTSLYETLPRELTLCAIPPMMQSADALISALCGLALSDGQNCVALCHPLWPKRIEGLYLPEIKLLLTPERPQGKAETIDLNPLFPKDDRNEREHSFDRNAFELMEQRAVEQLKKAKALHDELEALYIANMDFSKHEEWRQRIVNEIRALSME